ncbi:hypothetical protein HaLaN_02434 [Haematococcus lacustris]|uniref:Uncharacterized protein n=1 Tax=Haematococcus lacustris TaxID=44745 RepID=A0A699YBQ2_HAELA|nr:hypothetical protein HaLaN_02434 [Haematococcus lacustris]
MPGVSPDICGSRLLGTQQRYNCRQALVVLASSASPHCTDTYHAGTGYCLGLHQQQQRAYVLECGNYHRRPTGHVLQHQHPLHVPPAQRCGAQLSGHPALSLAGSAKEDAMDRASFSCKLQTQAFRLLLLELASQGQQTNSQFGYDRAALLADPRLPGILLYHVIPGAGQITRRMELFDGQRFFSLNNRMVTVLRWAGSNKQGPPLPAAAGAGSSRCWLLPVPLVPLAAGRHHQEPAASRHPHLAPPQPWHEV